MVILGDDIEHGRSTYHKTCGTEYQQSYRRLTNQFSGARSHMTYGSHYSNMGSFIFSACAGVLQSET